MTRLRGWLNMKMLLPFGDWSEDGHRHYTKLQIEAPSMEHLYNAQIKIKEKYGKNFFEHFANEYEDCSLGKEVVEALLDIDYDFPKEGDPLFTGFKSDYHFKEYVNEFEQEDHDFELTDIQDMFIKLLNAFGAEITIIPEDEQIPMICNWTCRGFETVGYGCFYD